jgi:hypothetical protein
MIPYYLSWLYPCWTFLSIDVTCFIFFFFKSLCCHWEGNDFMNLLGNKNKSVRLRAQVTVTCREIFRHECNFWRAGSQRVLWERRIGENSQTTKFSFARASKLLLVIRTRTWRRPNQMYWTRWSEPKNFGTFQSLTRQGSPSRSKTRGCGIVALVINKRRSAEQSWVKF